LSLILAVAVIGTTWGWWGVTTPATITSDGRATVLGIEATVTSQSAGARTVLAGSAARADHPQLVAVQQLLVGVGERYGCGTLMWDNGDVATDDGPIFGDPQVFWQVPIWTDGCINASDGILVHSSMTAPSMAMTKSLVSRSTEELLPDRKQYTYDLANGGSARMQLAGIRYYLTHGGQPDEDATKDPLLTKVATAGPWTVWEVQKGVVAASLTALPAVYEPALTDAEWEAVSNAYFGIAAFETFPLAQSGPSSWPRAGRTQLPPPTTIEPAGVTNIRSSTDRIVFDVTTVGRPVIVRASAFPGWTVEGADGPYRATSNYLVVVPTSTTVTLVKGRTWIDWLAIVLALVGLGIIVAIVVHRVMDRRSATLAVDLEEQLVWDESWDDDDAADEGGSDDVTDADGPAEDRPANAVDSATPERDPAREPGDAADATRR
jgi:hypothetical protein